jgi:hypothetical protein
MSTTRLELANKLINLPQITTTMEQMVNAMLQAFKGFPMLFAPTDAQWDALGKGILEAMKSDLGAVYAEAMDEQELEFIIAFYEDPIGVRVMGKMSSMLPKFTELGEMHGNRIAQRILDGDSGVFVN